MPGTLLGYFSFSLKNSNNACIEFKNSYSTIKVIIKLGGHYFFLNDLTSSSTSYLIFL